MFSAAAAGLVIGGCAAGRSGEAPVATGDDARPATDRAVAFAGEPLAVVLIGLSDGPAPATVTARLDDGRAVTGRVHRYEVSRSQGPPTWLAHAHQWRERAPGARTVGVGVDLAVVETPEDWAGGAVRLGDVEVKVRRVAPGAASSLWDGLPWPAALTAPIGQSSLFVALAPAIDDPALRWRAAFVADRAEAAGATVLAERLRSSIAAQANEPSEPLARSVEARWRAGLDRLARADEALARSVADRLTLVVETPGGRAAPGWPPPTGAWGLDALLSTLENESLDDRALVDRARTWLGLQPGTVAWVTDDAGLADPASSLALVRVGVTDLTGEARVAQAVLDPARPGPRVTLAPRGSALVAASSPIDRAPGVVEIEAGSWRTALRVAAGPLAVGPPGFRAGPVAEPWSLASWLAGTPTFPGADRAAAALVRRRTDGAWEVYIECRFPGDAPPPGDRVRVWFGPTGRPIAVLEVTAAGTVRDATQDTDDQPAPAEPIIVRRGADRWSCVIELPAQAIEGDGIVRLAVERRDDAGRRWTWPRPVTPWQEEPGRAALDVRRWAGAP